MKQNINEQTKSSFISDTVISGASVPFYNNETEDMEKSRAKKSSYKNNKIKAYHPKMMIFYKNIKLTH